MNEVSFMTVTMRKTLPIHYAALQIINFSIASK